MRLNVYEIIGIEYLLPNFTAILFDLVYYLASAIISAIVSCRSSRRISFSIFP